MSEPLSPFNIRQVKNVVAEVTLCLEQKIEISGQLDTLVEATVALFDSSGAKNWASCFSKHKESLPTSEEADSTKYNLSPR